MLRRFFHILTTLTERERLFLGGATILFLTALFFIGWRSYLASTTIVPARGGSYSEGIVGQPTFINPVTAASEVDQDLTTLLFANLTQLSQSAMPGPDQKTWIVTLKKDLRWDDGQKLTADDVIFTLNLIQDANTQSPLANDWQQITAERLNENEIRFILREPAAFFTDNLRRLRPLPKHIFADIPSANFHLSNYNLEPIGSGPYRYAGFDKEKNGFITAYRLDANPAFAGGPPLIERLTIKFFGNTEDLVTAFNQRDISAAGGLDAADIDALTVGHRIFRINIPRYYAIFFNLSNIPTALKDRAARRALALALDKNRMVTDVFRGGAMPIDGPIFPGIEGYQKEEDGQRYQPEEARKLFAAHAPSSTLEISMVVPQVSFLTDAARLIQKMWGPLGIRLDLIVVEPAEVTNQFIRTRSYTLILFGNILKSIPDLLPFWHSGERFYPGLNLAVYHNKDVDLLLEAVRKEHNKDNRSAQLAKLQEAILRDQPAIFLFSPSYFYVTTNNLHGFSTELLATASDRFTDVHHWYLKTKREFK